MLYPTVTELSCSASCYVVNDSRTPAAKIRRELRIRRNAALGGDYRA